MSKYGIESLRPGEEVAVFLEETGLKHIQCNQNTVLLIDKSNHGEIWVAKDLGRSISIIIDGKRYQYDRSIGEYRA